MDNVTLTTIATVLLVIVGFAQVFVLIAQKRQTRIALTAEYWRLWNEYSPYWGNVIFIGRSEGEYYQVLNKRKLAILRELIHSSNHSAPTTWALKSVQKVFGLLGEVSIRILQGHLHISDAYPIFGSEFLRQGNPIRKLLEVDYGLFPRMYLESDEHLAVRKEVQDWLIYHDGLRRRCLILIDMLWAEAARLEDLPPEEMRKAADAKLSTGYLNRKRIFRETIQLNGINKIFWALHLRCLLKRSEYFSKINWKGIKKKRLDYLETAWVKRLLREY